MLEGMLKAFTGLFRRAPFYFITVTITSLAIIFILMSPSCEVKFDEEQRLRNPYASKEALSFLDWVWSLIYQNQKPKTKPKPRKSSNVVIRWKSLFKFARTCFSYVVKLPTGRIAFGGILAISLKVMWDKFNLSFPSFHRFKFMKTEPVLTPSDHIATVRDSFQSPRSSVTCSGLGNCNEFGFGAAVKSKTYSAGHIRVKVSYLPEIDYLDCEWKRIVILHETAKLTGISTVLKYFKPAAIKVKAFPPISQSNIPLPSGKPDLRWKPRVLIVIQTLPQNPEASKIYKKRYTEITFRTPRWSVEGNSQFRKPCVSKSVKFLRLPDKTADVRRKLIIEMFCNLKEAGNNTGLTNYNGNKNLRVCYGTVNPSIVHGNPS